MPGREHATGKTGSSEGGAVPDKYYVVANNDHVRVKHILIFETSSTDRNKVKKYVNLMHFIYECLQTLTVLLEYLPVHFVLATDGTGYFRINFFF